MSQDIRLAVRMLAKGRSSTVIAITTLAIAIGANTAIFSVLNAALLKLLPVRNPNELVMLTDPNSSMVLGGMLPGERSLLGYEEFTYLRDRSKTTSGVCASQLPLERWPVQITRGPQEQARGRLVSENYFDVFGVRAAIGRLFLQSDATGVGNDPYAVISYNYWQRRFGGNRSVLGTTIRIRQATLVIVGVAAPGFRGETVGQDPDLWLPMLMQPLVMPGWHGLRDFMDHSQDKLMWLHVFARRKPGVSIAQVQAELNLLFRQILEAGYSRSMAPLARKDALSQRVRVRALRSGAFHGREEFAEQWTILSALASLVLLIACANIANLLLARAAGRTREVAIRLSVGARKGRIVRQFLIESLLLATLGGIAGILVAAVAGRFLPVLLAHGSGGLELPPDMDLRVLAFTAGTVLVIGILVGLAPALRATGGAIHERLKETGRSVSGSRQRTRFANALVITQVALSFLLVLGAGLFLQTLRNLQTVSLGYPRENLLLVEVDSTGVTQPVNLDRQLTTEMREIPGVLGVTYSDRPLLNGFDGAFAINVEGFTSTSEEDRGSTGGFVGPEYFSTVGIPILAGHEIGPRDVATSPRVGVINEAFAKHFFPGRNPIGKHLTINSTSLEIVGIARDARVTSLRGAIEPKFYAAADQNVGAFSFEIRTLGDPNRLVNVVRRSILGVDENLSISDMQTLDQKVQAQNAQPRLITHLCTTFGVIALFLASIGIYAVLSYNVARRRNEFGIRMALGAERRRITGMILHETGLMIAAGLIAGVIAAAVAARLLAAQLYGVNPTGPRWSLARYEHVDSAMQLYGIRAMDMLTIVGTIFVLVAIALIAAYIPAAGAAQVDPASVLRHE
ncbi:MAG: ABC transporter permease [Acidobacteriaceae bacterium]|nr:ABC transporter permease [Acidobacteriaceae bacterium]